MSGHSRTAYDEAGLMRVLEEQCAYTDALIVYFNRSCDTCVTAMDTWAKEGLLACANAFFVEFNESTQRHLKHVTHVPSYERCQKGTSIAWSTGFPMHMQTTKTTKASTGPVLTCRLA